MLACLPRTQRFVWIVATILLSTGGCFPAKEASGPTIQSLMDEVCEHSQKARYDRIPAILLEMGQVGGSAEQVAYAQLMLKGVETINEISLIVVTARSLIGDAFTSLASGSDLSGIVHRIASDLRTKAYEFVDQANTVVGRYPNGSVRVNECVLYFGNVPIVSLSGEVDASDVWGVLALTHSIVFVFELIQSQNFGIDLLGAVSIVRWFENEAECQPSLVADKRCIMRFGAWALKTFPKLLTTADGGKEAYQRTAVEYIRTEEALEAFIQSMLNEKDDQGDDLFVTSNVKQRGDLWDLDMSIQNISMPALLSSSWLDGALIDGRTIVYRQTDEERVSVHITPELFEAIRAVRGHLETGEGLLDVQDMLLPYAQIMSPFVVALLSDEFDTLFDSFDPSGELRQGFGSSGLRVDDVLTVLVEAVFPKDFVYFDMYGFLENPVDLRTVLPRFDYQLPGEPVDVLAVDWECPYNETRMGLCDPKYSVIVDSLHFGSREYELEADTLREITPYLSLQDPTLGGYLYVDMAQVPQTETTQVLPRRADTGGPEHQSGPVNPDNYVLNFSIHRVVAYIAALVEKVAN